MLKKPSHYQDLIGQSFGLLDVVNRVESHDGQGAWFNCYCNGCNKYKEIRGRSLKNKDAQSCGCNNKKSKTGENNKLYKGYKKITGEYYNNLRKSAKERGHEFKISLEELWELWENQCGFCALSGVRIFLPRGSKDKSDKTNTASVDRIDSNKGYTKDNCQWVHKRINWMKNNMQDNEFQMWCIKVGDHINKKINKKLIDEFQDDLFLNDWMLED